MTSVKPVAIVTGSAQGLGYSIAKELLENGYKVCLTDINEEKGNLVTKKLQEKYGDSNVTFRICNVTERTHYKDVFEYVLSKFKKIDLLVNNAGILNEFNHRKVIDINLMGCIYGCEIALEYMGKDKGGNGGTVLNIASILGLVPHEDFPVYSASKHGVVGLTRSYGMSKHYKRSDVVFCALCPAYINTDLLEDIKTQSLSPGLDVTTREDLLSPSYVAKAAMKLIEDKKNGSTLAVTEEKCFGYQYIGLGQLDGFVL